MRVDCEYGYNFYKKHFWKAEITKYFDGLKLWGGAEKWNKTDTARMTLQRGAYVQKLLWWKSKIITSCECVSSLRYPPCSAHNPYLYEWPARICSIIPHYFINGIFFKEVVEHRTCVLIFSTNFVRNISHSQMKWARYKQKQLLVLT
jgi:hypothetical protein